MKAGTHSALLKGSHTAAHTAKHGAFRMGVVSLPSERFTRFGNPAWPGGRTANFAAFGSWSETLLKNAESLRSSDALMRVAVPRRRGPAGLRYSVCNLVMLLFFSLCVQYFLNVRGGGGITTLGAFHTVRKPCVAGYQNGKLCRFWVLAGCTPEGRRKPAGQRCAYARRCSEASRPRRAA